MSGARGRRRCAGRGALLLALVALWGGCSDDDVVDAAPETAPVDLAADRGQPDLAADAASPDQAGEAPAGDAAAPGTWRVGTFNCQCKTESWETRAKGVAAEIAALDLDVIGLQEVCQQWIGDSYISMVTAELQALTGAGWEHRWVKTHENPLALGDEGLAILAPQGAIGDSGDVDLTKGGGLFPRKVLWATIEKGGAQLLFHVTHLTISLDPADRTTQVQEILQSMVARQTAATPPRILVGDFNALPSEPAIAAATSGTPELVDAWAQVHPGEPGLTHAADDPTKRIDYIMVEAAPLAALQSVELAFDEQHQGVWLSDHRGLAAVLRFAP